MPGKIKARSKPSKQTAKTLPLPASSTSAKSTKLKSNRTRKPAPNNASPVSESGSENEEEQEEGEGDDQSGEDEDLEQTSSEDGEDEDDEGVDEEGMKKLMEALGEDGLDDVGRMQLEALQVGDDSEEENEEVEDEEQRADASEAEGEEEGESGSEEEGDGNVSGSARQERQKDGDKDNGDDDEEIALEDAESVDEDAVPRQKIVTNNKIALERIRDTIKLDPSLPWTETLTVTYPESIYVDVNDDLNRELAFYKQALHGATTARTLAAQHSLPFTRPADYFAEMVKSDAHMERIRQKLLDESAQIKRAEVKRREREGKKYGKQVQIEKMKERERSKKEMEERLKGLKRKHKDALPSGAGQDDEAFDVAVEDALADKPRPSKRAKTSSSQQKPKLSRKARDSKFGFGTGKGRREKQNTKASTEKFDYAVGGKGKKGKGKGAVKSKRPGKSKRAAMKNR